MRVAGGLAAAAYALGALVAVRCPAGSPCPVVRWTAAVPVLLAELAVAFVGGW